MITLWLKRTNILTISVLLLLGLPGATLSLAQTVASREQAGNILAIEKLTVQGGRITGEIRNKSKNTVRDTELFIRYTFLWKNEFHPGKDDPSTAFYHTVTGDIAPGGSIRFKFTPSAPLLQRSDGKFEGPSVSIAGFTQIIPQRR